MLREGQVISGSLGEGVGKMTPRGGQHAGAGDGWGGGSLESLDSAWASTLSISRWDTCPSS